MSMQVPFVDLNRLHDSIRTDLDTAYERVLSSNAYILGKETHAFEEAFAEQLSCKHVIGCSNGTDALILAFLAAGIGAGDEVICPSHTFFATAEAIVSVGAIPVCVDIDPRDGCIDPNCVAEAITDKTRAIVPVHIYGQPCRMDELRAIAEQHSLLLIEDAAQAHAARYKGQAAGTIGNAGTFSFYPGKNLGALGDAGALVTNDDSIAEVARSLRDHGRQEKYSHGAFGWNMRMDGLQAAFLSAKLPHLARWTAERYAAAAQYRKAFVASDGFRLLDERDEVGHCYHLFVAVVSEPERFQSELKQRGVASGRHYPLGCHQQPAWDSSLTRFPLTETEFLAKHCVSLPIFAGIANAEVNLVIEAVNQVAPELAPFKRVEKQAAA